VPYQVFPTRDSFIMVSAGNDTQFAVLCSPEIFDRTEWTNDARFSTNRVRVENREEMVRLIEEVLAEKTTADWGEKLTGKG
jgi:succinate--hydroxymethylglutarate CoA-transferase